MNDKIYSVLIIDDEIGVRESLADFLEDLGWIVYTAVTAEEALQILEDKSVDGALVDIRLPGMQGDIFIRTANKTSHDLCYIVMTGSPDYHLPIGNNCLPRTLEVVLRKPIRDLFALETLLKKHILSYKRKHYEY